eukprot:TRINITY_DN31474_c0_g1_i1.p1 TRINITY_DN31474_c0_g1~~TRINITY_DN31474_c0_g1_i1.p1  ORF type:complete len:2595 (-),score=668.49 TRINITY_DN31474_c0_g1_i1:121-7905(-)
MAGRGGGAYINGRYVANPGKGKGGKGGGKEAGTGRTTGWAGGRDRDEDFQRKPGDEDVALERKFDIDILQPGESRIGYLFNMKVTRHYDEGGRQLSGMVLYFLQRDGCTFRCTFVYRPYMFVQIPDRDNFESMRDILQQRFSNEGVFAEIIEREDLEMEDHIVGRKRQLIKLSFDNEEGLGRARKDLMKEMNKQKKDDGFDFDADDRKQGSIMSRILSLYEYDVPYVCRLCIDNKINCGRWFAVTRHQQATSADNIWDTQCTVAVKEEMLAKPGLRIFAWDIECTKEPLKFPDSAKDRITLISAMVDGSGFLIVNRSEVSEDIEPLEYTPKPEYEGIFETFNEPDEASLLRRFFSLIRETNPHVSVTFNGDFFDMPFVTNRAKAYNLDFAAETGIEKSPPDDYYSGKWIIHIDCFAWVQRDSYLPCGARGLKAVTRYKLKYDPVELDPEDMTPFAKERPQELAAYSVSDAVATYYLYMKYIHDFILALASIIPYAPDDVLRKGSGTLCESLLMNQAFHAQVLFPNKHIDDPLEYHGPTNRLIEQSTYEGARVECMRVGVFRADIKETFQLEPSAFQVLLNDLKPTVDFFLCVEEKVKLEDVENYDEILAEIERQLRALCDPDKVAAQIGRRMAASDSPTKKQETLEEDEYNLKPIEYEFVEGSGGVKSGGKRVKRVTERVIKDDFPYIYHLDVGAMYPNIILSNRLQPSAIVTNDYCASCSYNDAVNNCKRNMQWKWRGELYMATRADVKSIVNEMENEKRRYNTKDRDSGEIKRVKWTELSEKERVAEITKAVRTFSQKAYARLKTSVYEDRFDTVCQRENPFYVNTVLNFRDRRYVFKRKTKEWTKALEKAEEAGDGVKMQEAKDMVSLNDSLQLAHKCILNSFYGYVMRKGARWHSMKMAGIVTFTGSNLIREAREFCEMVGLPLELDTDGIWCLLPKSFPDTFKFKLKGGKEIKMPYPNCVLNYRVHEKYTNHQYQERGPNGEWQTRSENSIFFEIDGPYRAMIIPASTEEDKMLKKRYAVYNFDGSLAELKGFEIKRRGELKLIQVFQEEVFPEYLKGATKEEVYTIVGNMANRWLDVIESHGRTMTDDEVLYFFSENKSMSKSVEASGSHRSVQITTAKRLAEFLGIPSMLTDDGINCHMLIANKPANASTTDRAIPVKIFNAEYEVKKQWLRKWCEDPSLSDLDMRSIIDWEYYKSRLVAVFQKLISIPASYQKISNPCPRVKVPEWLRKRVAEQNDKFQQRSLALYMKKATPGEPGDGSKRKLCDLEDLAIEGFGARRGGAAGGNGGVSELPVVEFGKGPKKWLEVQRVRWEAAKRGAVAGSGGGKQLSLFDEGLSWTRIAAEAMHGTWHVLSVEPARTTQGFATLRVGDTVNVEEDEDMDMGVEGVSQVATQRGSIVGFVGGLVRVALDDGSERLAKRSTVRQVKEEGLFVVSVATEPGGVIHRFEVMVKRRIVLGLESNFSPEEVRRGVLPKDLTKGLRVWPSKLNPLGVDVGPGIVKMASPEVGMCAVTWTNGTTQVHVCDDLEVQCGSVQKVLRDAPRNLRHACLVELEYTEEEFQRQQAEGALGDHDTAWPRVDAVYESEQPLDFDLICRMGPLVKLAATERLDELSRGRTLRLLPEDLTCLTGPSDKYLPGRAPAQNIYMQFCFDKTRPARCFCGLFAPALSEAYVCFSGFDAAQGEEMRAGLESLLSEKLTLGGLMGVPGSLPEAVRVTAKFVNARSPTPVVQWAEQQMQELRRRDGAALCVLVSQLSTNDLRGLSPSLWVEQRQLLHLSALREIPICRAPFHESDSQFPALDWPRWIATKFVDRVPMLYGWYQDRMALCRVGGLPVCNAPEVLTAITPVALDALFARQLKRDAQIRWASPTNRPDLGETSLALTDVREGCLASTNWLLQGQDLAEGRAGGQVNRPGTYRSVCLEVNLKTKLCVCALQYARYLSDMEGGELSRKRIRKVQGAAAAGGENLEGGAGRNLDHSSEVSVTSLESLVTMVQEIAEKREAKAKEISTLKTRWAAQGEKDAVAAAAEIPEEDDAGFLQTMQDAGLENAVLASRLEDLRDECGAYDSLLDGLYSWIASPASLLHDPALLRRVHQYMDRVLHLFMGVLKRNGCQVIHASYSKVLFATGKLRVFPDIMNFWESLRDNAKSVKVLEPLQLSNTECLSEMFYGVVWMDPANWAAVPISQDTGEIEWRAKCRWKVAEFLPAAVRPSLALYAADLLIGPQRELDRRYVSSALAGADGNDAEAAACAMDVDAGDERCDGGLEDDQDGADAEGGAAAAEPAKDSAAGAGDAADKVAKVPKSAEVMEELKAFMRGDFFVDLRDRVLKYVRDIQVQQARDAGLDLAEETGQGDDLDGPGHLNGDEDESNSEDEDGPDAAERRAERRRKHLQEKWRFPDMPGRREAPGSVEMEFMRTLVQILRLEDWLSDLVLTLRDRLCQLLKVSSFSRNISTSSHCFPLLLRDVVCQRCTAAAHVDVTSHACVGPGLWKCPHCQAIYDKDTMQGMLVELLEGVVQAWQAQNVSCSKCKKFRNSKLQNFCECFGRFQERYKADEMRLILRMLRSLVQPHDLHWLGQCLQMHEVLLG